MGDLRNKIAKIERAKRDKAAMEAFLRRGGHWPEPQEIPSHMVAIVCRGCLHNDREKTIYAFHRGHFDRPQFWCLDCMPADVRAEAGL